MSTSVFFNNFTNSQEQLLIEDLILESIKIYGHDCFYCPRTLVAKDDIYGEDAVSEFNTAYEIDLYIRSYDSYEGDGNFLSKFNLEIRDQMTLTISIRNFNNEVGQYAMIDRPQEGDIIYIPMINRIMVIKYVNKTPTFYQMGSIQMYDLVTEVYEYSGEKLNTGIKVIDDIERDNSMDMGIYGILSQDGYVIIAQDGYDIIQEQYNAETQAHDYFDDSHEIQLESDGILDWTRIDPFSEGRV